jgi:hypothetical protein
MKVKIDSLNMGILIDLLAREVNILRDECDYWGGETKRLDNLLAEKAEIIKMLGQQLKGAPKKRGRPKKVTSVTTAPKKVGRPKGSKNRVKK